jgi:hypothetical protein
MSKRKPTRPTVAAAYFLLLVSAPAAFGQVQSTAQQNCITKLNKDGAAVAGAQGKENVACVKNAGKNKLTGTAQACLTADAKSKVQAKKNATIADDAADCGTAPGFGYTGATAVNASAVQGKLDLVADIFGANLDAAVIDCDTSNAGCGCQSKVIKDVEKLAKTKLGEFLKCKKQVLKDGASSTAALAACVDSAGTAGSIAADTKGKVQKSRDKLVADIGAACDTPGVTGAFPASCTSLSGAALGDCLDARVECRVCQIINEMDGLFVNCDLFDDGSVNGSCASGAGPTPTPTLTLPPTLTPTQTPTFTPAAPGFKGALGPPTTGLFNYAGTGIPGSNAACNTNFPGSHTCTYAELQTWDAANQLIGLLDTNSNPVTSFWAIDSGQPGTRQCDNPVPWGYQTAHTGHFGDKVPLTAGHLAALQPSQLCLGTSWVGCCI